MSRIRTIKPEFWTDDLLGSLKREDRLLFIASWNLADDEGLLRWSSPFLKGAVFPFDDDISVQSVEGMMDALVECGIVFPYVGGRSQQSLAYVVNFQKHQKINRPTPSKLPPPSLQDHRVRDMYAARDGWRCHLCDGEIDRGFSAEYQDDFVASPDHVLPVSMGGSDYPSNIKAAHVTCNKGRGNRSVEEYRRTVMSGKTNAQFRRPERFTHINTESPRNDSLTNSVSPSSQDREGKKEIERERELSADADAIVEPPLLIEVNGHSAKPCEAAPKERYPAEYEELWREYQAGAQNKNSSKADAFKAWRKLGESDRESCFIGVVKYAEEVTKGRNQGSTYTPKHLETFINKRGWEPYLEKIE